jgi:hypothetical protein
VDDLDHPERRRVAAPDGARSRPRSTSCVTSSGCIAFASPLMSDLLPVGHVAIASCVEACRSSPREFLGLRQVCPGLALAGSARGAVFHVAGAAQGRQHFLNGEQFRGGHRREHAGRGHLGERARRRNVVGQFTGDVAVGIAERVSVAVQLATSAATARSFRPCRGASASPAGPAAGRQGLRFPG